MKRVRYCPLLAAAAVCAALAAPALAQDASRATQDEKQSATRQLQTTRPAVKLEKLKPATTEVECSGFIENLWSWVNENHGLNEGAHRIGAKMASVKMRGVGGADYPWGHGSYSEGGFGWGGDKLVGRFKVLFSDRKSGAGARFDAAQADIQDVTLYKDGRIEIMLRSWGNVVLPLHDLRCYKEGFLTGITREGNGVSMVSFALRKEIITPDSHPALLWP